MGTAACNTKSTWAAPRPEYEAGLEMPSLARSKTRNSPQRHFVLTGPGCCRSRTESASRRPGGMASPHPEQHTLAVVAHAPKAPAAGPVAWPPHTPNGTRSPWLLTHRKRQPQARWHCISTPRTAHTRRGRSRTGSASRRHGGMASPHPDRHTLPVVDHAPIRRS